MDKHFIHQWRQIQLRKIAQTTFQGMVAWTRIRRPRSDSKVTENAEELKENDEEISAFSRSWRVLPNSRKILSGKNRRCNQVPNYQKIRFFTTLILNHQKFQRRQCSFPIHTIQPRTCWQSLCSRRVFTSSGKLPGRWQFDPARDIHLRNGRRVWVGWVHQRAILEKIHDIRCHFDQLLHVSVQIHGYTWKKRMLSYCIRIQ